VAHEPRLRLIGVLKSIVKITQDLMKKYISFFLLLTCKVYAQAPVYIKTYLNNHQVSQTAKDFYYGKFMATDDTKTLSIIDSLHTKNDLTRPFYLYLVSRMIPKSDGALSELLGVSCKDFIEVSPDFLIDFLYAKNAIVDKRFLGDWANQIAGEFLIDCEGEKQCILLSLQKASTMVRLDNKAKLADFYKKIEGYCN
jgi:hypothetical protein